MTNLKITSIDGGSTEYWRQRKVAFGLIRDAERAAKALADAPMYFHGGYDADGDVIAIENLEPHDDMGDAIRAVAANETARSILEAQGRTEIGGCRIAPFIPVDEETWGGIKDPAPLPNPPRSRAACKAGQIKNSRAVLVFQPEGPEPGFQRNRAEQARPERAFHIAP